MVIERVPTLGGAPPRGRLKATSNAGVRAGKCRAWRCRLERETGDELCTYHMALWVETGSVSNLCVGPGCDREATGVSSDTGAMLCSSHRMQRYLHGYTGPWAGADEPVLLPLDPAKMDSAERRGMATLDRFMLDVEGDPETGCWQWTGQTHIGGNGMNYGYGTFWVGGESHYAHRWAWANVAGLELVPGLVLDHICRNPACVRPGHLQQVTPQENSRMASTRRRPPPPGLIEVNPVKHRSIREWVLGGYYGLPIWHGNEGEIITEYLHDVI